MEYLLFLILNDQLAEFSSMKNSIETSFQIILGNVPSIFIINRNNNFLLIILFVAYIVSMVFIMVNVFLTILSENYAIACSDKQLDKEDPELFSYLKSVLSSVWYNFCCFIDNNTNKNEMDK